MNKRRLFYSLPIILLLIIAVAGRFATDYLGNKARQEIIGESQSSVLTLSIYASSTFTTVEGTVKSLAGSPWIAPALLSKRDQDIEHANSALDRYNSALNASVSYLMDANGMTVASSNRKDPDSFVGKSYRFRPYFQEAAKGKPSRYFALGITSGKRGFYASYPVQNRLGKLLGVVTMKKDLDEMETFFGRYPFRFLVSRDGIIFLSSSPAMVLKSLWPLDKAVLETLIASQQFGNNLSEAVFKKEFSDGTEVTLKEKDYFVSRRVIDSDGWSIVLLTPTDRIRDYKLIGILATIFVGLLIMVFSGIIYVIDRSKEAIRESEELYRSLTEKSIVGVYVVQDSKFRFLNSNLVSYTGYTREELLGKEAGLLINPEDREKVRQNARAMLLGEMSSPYEFRIITKQGETLWIMETVTSIIHEGRPAILGNSMNVTERKRVEEALRESEELFRSYLENAPDGVYMSDLEGNFLYGNRKCEEITGSRREELIGKNFLELNILSEKSLHKAVQLLQANIEGNSTGPDEIELISKEGRLIPVEINTSVVQRMGQRIVLAFVRDITDRKRTEEALRDSEEKYRSIFDNAPLGLLHFNKKGITTSCNDKFVEIIGSSREVLMGLNMLNLPDKHIVEAVKLALNGKPGYYDGEYRSITSNKATPMHALFRPITSEKGEVLGGVGIIEDITERKQAEEKIRQMAYHDSLTGLPNRKLFSDRLGIALAQAQRNQKEVGIAMLDLDHFKDVNDTLGHDMGDLLLQATAERLSAALRKGDTVARFGGDEFLLILPDLKVIEDAIQVARKIVDSFRKPFLIDTHQLVVTTSIGIAVYPNDGTDEGILLKNADIAMYQAKQAGGDRYQLCIKA